MACSLFSKSALAGHWTCEAYGLRANVVAQDTTFPIDKSNNKEGSNAVRLVNVFLQTAKLSTATSGDGNHKSSRGLTPLDARRTGPDLSQ